MRQKVLISAALLHDPDILVLDEPCSGLDVSTTLVLREMIQRLSAVGKIIVYSSHVMDMVEKVSSRVLIVHRGRVVADNSVSALRDLLSLPSLEAVFAELTVEEDVAATAGSCVRDAGLIACESRRFHLLVRLFSRRFFENDLLAPDIDLRPAAIWLCAALATPAFLWTVKQIVPFTITVKCWATTGWRWRRGSTSRCCSCWPWSTPASSRCCAGRRCWSIGATR